MNYYTQAIKSNTFITKCRLVFTTSLLTAAFILSLGLITHVSARSTCDSVHGARQVTEFGQFIPDSASSAIAAINAATVNNAIQQIGSNGGGTICFPAGAFYLIPDQIYDGMSAININYDNVTLWGEGVGRTVLHTRSDYSVINGAVVRGHGILINGTTNCSAPRKNIVLRDFELDGGAGYTGNFGWPADPETGDGWDITHKGIILAFDTCVDNVTLENIHVHSYRGEVIYAGGSGLGKVTIRNIKSEDTNASTYNILADATIENSEFGKSRFWVEIGTAFSGKKAVFRNNYFHDANVEGAIGLAQGDLSYQPYLFENNRFEQCRNNGVVFHFLGGVGGPIEIRNNQFVNCGGMYVGYAPNAAPWARYENQNITFEDNQLTNPVVLAYFLSQGSNITVRNNTVNNTRNTGATTAVVYCCTGWSNVLVENNSFNNVRTPEQPTVFSGGERPLFQNNTYTNTETRYQQGVYYLTSSERVITPLFEQTFVTATAADLEVVLNTNNYPDWQKTKITVQGHNAIKFVPGAASYIVAATRTVNPGETISFDFSKELGKWFESKRPAQRKLSLVSPVQPRPLNSATKTAGTEGNAGTETSSLSGTTNAKTPVTSIPDKETGTNAPKAPVLTRGLFPEPKNPDKGEPGGDPVLVEAVFSVRDTLLVNLVPDFERVSGTLVGNELALPRAVTDADIGKVVAIKNARFFGTFRGTRLTWNGYISGVSNGKAIVSSAYRTLTYGDPDAQRLDISNTEVLLGTNNYDNIQEAMDETVARGKKRLALNFSGTVYVVPALSEKARNAPRNFKGWTIGGPQRIVVAGLGMNLSKIKFGTEDNATDGDFRADIFNFHALNYATEVELRDMTWESADRVSTMSRVFIGGMQGVGSNPRGIVLRRFKLSSPDIKVGWDTGIEETNVYNDGVGFAPEKLKVAVLNSEIQAGNPVTIFSQNGAAKKYVARNAKIKGGGKAVWKMPFVDSISLANVNGFTQLTVNDPGFSLHEMTSYDEWYNKSPYVQIHPPTELIAMVKLIGGEIKVDIPASVFDGNRHAVKLALADGLSINDLPPYSRAHSIVNDMIFAAEDTGYLNRTEIWRLLQTGLPYSFVYYAAGTSAATNMGFPHVRILPAFSAFLRDGTSRNTARVIINPDAPGPLSADDFQYFQGGTIIVNGRPSRSFEGHAHYIHPNVEMNINGMEISEHGRLGMRYGSDNGVTGQHSEIMIKNWAETPVAGIPYFFYERNPSGGIMLHGENFTGVAELGQSVYRFNYDIALPSRMVPDELPVATPPIKSADERKRFSITGKQLVGYGNAKSNVINFE